MAIQTQVTIDGVSLGTPINNRVNGYWELSYYVKDDEGMYTYSQEFGPEDEINERVSILENYPKVISKLWIVEPGDTNEGVVIMEFENSLVNYDGDSVGSK